MKKSIGKFGTILIILVTVILAGVAIFTALRLYQLRQQPVAPNVPTSQPKAGTACTDDVKQCPDGSYVRRVPPDCNFAPCAGTCTDDVKQCPDGSYVRRVPPDCNFAPCAGSCSIGFTLAPSQCNGSCVTNADCQSGSTTSTIGASSLICYQPAATPCPSGQACVTVMPPKVCRNPSCTTQTNCLCPTPTPVATPTPTPTATSTKTPTPTPTGTSTGSPSSSPVSSGTPKPTSTATSIAVATPTPPSLPVSGTDWPTIFGAAIGFFVIVGSLLLAL